MLKFFWVLTLHSLEGRYQYLKQYTVTTFRTEVSGSGKSGCTCRAIWMVVIQNQGRVKKETKSPVQANSNSKQVGVVSGGITFIPDFTDIAELV
jgi:hypothetical protein